MSYTVMAIDIGSTKICTLIADVNGDKIHLIGTGIAKSQGFKKGSIINIDLAYKAIKAAADDARRVAGVDAKKAIVSVSGAYTKNIISSGIVNIPSKEISVKEVNRVMQTALYNASVSGDYEILHALPYDFKVDEQSSIQDPVGMSGTRLEVSVNIIAIQKSTLENIKKTIKRTDIEIENLVLNAYAASIAAVKYDEKEHGACVIDLGGATCNLVIHLGSSVRYSDFLGVGGINITGDLSMALHTPIDVAEGLKRQYSDLTRLSDNDEIIKLPIIGNENSDEEVSLDVISNVIYARVEETLMILADKIEKSDFRSKIGSGIILTGGVANMKNILEIASPIFFNMPVRIASPNKIVEGIFDSLKDPAFITVIGLLKYGAGEFTLYEIDSNKLLRTRESNVKAPMNANFNLNSNPEHTKSKALDINLDPLQAEEPFIKDENITTNNQRLDDIKIQDKSEPYFQKFYRWLTQLF